MHSLQSIDAISLNAFGAELAGNGMFAAIAVILVVLAFFHLKRL